MKLSFKKIISTTSLTVVFFLLIFLISFAKTEAFWGFGDISVDPANVVQNTTTAVQTTAIAGSSEAVAAKETILDSIAYAVAKEMLSNMIQETTDWVNSGFDGNPAYIEDPQRFMTGVGDKVVGDFILGDDRLKFLCSPFSADVKLALKQDFTRKYEPACTLSGVVDNIETAVEDLGNQWNWETWSEITQNPNNNAYGAYMEASFALNAEIDSEQKSWEMEIDWGKGFKPVKDCETVSYYNEGLDGGTYEQTEVCNNITMGDSIAGTVNKNLGAGQDALVAADEIDELIGAVISQIVTKALREGYKSLSEGSNDGGANGLGNNFFSIKDEASAEQILIKSINKAIFQEDIYQEKTEFLIENIIEKVKDLMEFYAEDWACEVSGHDEWFKGKVVILGRDIEKYEEEIDISEENVLEMKGMLESLDTGLSLKEIKELARDFQGMDLQGESAMEALSNIQSNYSQHVASANTKYVYCVAGATTGIDAELQEMIDQIAKAAVGTIGNMFSNEDDGTAQYYEEYADEYDVSCKDEIDLDDIILIKTPREIAGEMFSLDTLKNWPITATLETRFTSSRVYFDLIFDSDPWPGGVWPDGTPYEEGRSVAFCWDSIPDKGVVCQQWEWNAKGYSVRGDWPKGKPVALVLLSTGNKERSNIKYFDNWPFNDPAGIGDLEGTIGPNLDKNTCYGNIRPEDAPPVVTEDICEVIVDGENGYYKGINNEDRPYYSFNDPGIFYCSGDDICAVSVQCKGDIMPRYYYFPETDRIQNVGGVIWQPTSGTDSNLEIWLQPKT